VKHYQHQIQTFTGDSHQQPALDQDGVHKDQEGLQQIITTMMITRKISMRKDAEDHRDPEIVDQNTLMLKKMIMIAEGPMTVRGIAIGNQ
jgi:hypothetical protein